MDSGGALRSRLLNRHHTGGCGPEPRKVGFTRCRGLAFMRGCGSGERKENVLLPSENRDGASRRLHAT